MKNFIYIYVIFYLGYFTSLFLPFEMNLKFRSAFHDTRYCSQDLITDESEELNLSYFVQSTVKTLNILDRTTVSQTSGLIYESNLLQAKIQSALNPHKESFIQHTFS